MSEAELDALSRAVDGVESHDPVDLDDRAIARTFTPAGPEELSEGLRTMASVGLVTLVRGGGCHLAHGNLAPRLDLWLACDRLAGIEELVPAEGACRVGAGTTLGELREAAGAQGCEVPIDGPDAATVGGALAVGSVGPRSHGFGRARDAVLGLDVVLGSGEITRCGGRVVKNVSGYDLAKLYAGSFGSLGVITSAWLRTRPVAETCEVRRREVDDVVAAVPQAIANARRLTTRSCALVWQASGSSLLAEFAGSEAAVHRDVAEAGGDPVAADALEAAARLQWGTRPAVLRVRIAALPTEQASVVEVLAQAGSEGMLYPGPGLVYAMFAGAGPGELAAVDRAAALASGPTALEAAPVELKRQRCVFSAPAAEVALYRTLKQRFDPSGVLSPGRFAGHV